MKFGKFWIFDLDNTLHNAAPHIFPQINQAMTGYLQTHLALDEAAAVELRRHYAKRYGAIAGLSAGLIGPPGTPRDYAGAFAATPVFLGCSDVDPHIPLARVHETRDVLGRMGANVTERIYPGMGHTINADEIAEVGKLLAGIGGV